MENDKQNDLRAIFCRQEYLRVALNALLHITD